METHVRRKPPLSLSQPSIFYYKENILQLCAGAESYQHAGTHLRSFTSLSWKGATTPCSCLPASPGRELWPPTLVYQPHLEGSYNPLLSFTSLTWKGATTPWLKATTLSTTMDHVSSIFILDPIDSIDHNLQATFHHIFRLDLLHTFKLNIHQTETYNPINSFIESSTNQPTTWSSISNIFIIQITQFCMNTSLTDSNKTTEQIRHFIPHTSVKP